MFNVQVVCFLVHTVHSAWIVHYGWFTYTKVATNIYVVLFGYEKEISPPTPLLIPGLKKVDSSSQTGSCAPPFNVCRTIIINTYQIMLQICFITQVEKHQRSTTTKIMLHCHPWGTFFITNGCNKKVEPCILWTKKVLINLPE